ncbi:hypothetical protein HID58_060104 [Brassica napus]|uniref:Uncharacterized protein n=1 Tax=Brassica napus TaxID=3708 RepID=A0ABQ7ZV14_BRANA|nr:hypothetical protein HID58_060104 [Brassica napus]
MLSAPAWVSHSQRFTMSFNVQAALCFHLGEPLLAFSGRHSMTRRLFLNLLCHGRADGRFLSRNNPVKFDKYSKALYPPSYQELLFWLLQLLEFVKVVNPAGRCCALLEDLSSFSYVAELLLLVDCPLILMLVMTAPSRDH